MCYRAVLVLWVYHLITGNVFEAMTVFYNYQIWNAKLPFEVKPQVFKLYTLPCKTLSLLCSQESVLCVCV